MAARFRRDRDEKVNNLIRCLANYKSQMEYSNTDLNTDKVKQYEAVRDVCRFSWMRNRLPNPGSLSLHHVPAAYTFPNSWKFKASKRLNCEKSIVPILNSFNFGAIVKRIMLPGKFSRSIYNFQFRAQAEIHNVIATNFSPVGGTKFQPRLKLAI